MSSKILYHVKKDPELFQYSRNELNHVFADLESSFLFDEKIEKMSNEDIIKFIISMSNKRIMNLKREYSHSIAFQYDSEKEILYVAYSKPCWRDKFNKKFANSLIEKRMNILVEELDNLSFDCIGYSYNNENLEINSGKDIPTQVIISIFNYLPRVKKYFKEMSENFNIYVY